VFDLLQSNWPIVERVVDALCKQDRLTTPELDALIAGPESVDPESVDPDSAGPSLSEPSPPEPTLIGDAA